MQGRLAVAFLPNYGVSLAQAMIPAADLSVQISTAGKEASGTGNMKFALNGALTIGTLDGANVEIRDAVGPDNFFLFGLTDRRGGAPRAGGLRPAGLHRRAAPRSRRCWRSSSPGFFSLGDRSATAPILDNLRYRDPYFVCADFDAYVATEARAARPTAIRSSGRGGAATTSSGASRFSSDETIRQYAKEIWGLESVRTNLALLELPL